MAQAVKRQDETGDATDASNGQVRSVVRAMGILDLLSENPQGLGLSTLARLASLAPSTTHRLLTTLWSGGYVLFDAGSQCWRIGLQAFNVGSAFGHARDIARLSRPLMRSLMLELEETVNLAIVGECGVRFITQMEAAARRPSLAKPGASLPFHTSASGKAIMAHWEDEEFDRFLARTPLERSTRHTLVEPRGLWQERTMIRRRGYAIDDRESAADVRCVAAAVLDEFGEPKASLSISAPHAWLSADRMERIGKSLVGTVDRLTQRLGGGMCAS